MYCSVSSKKTNLDYILVMLQHHFCEVSSFLNIPLLRYLTEDPSFYQSLLHHFSIITAEVYQAFSSLTITELRVSHIFNLIIGILNKYKYINRSLLLFLDWCWLSRIHSKYDFLLLINGIVSCPVNFKAGDTLHLSCILLLYHPTIRRVNVRFKSLVI